jgi:hypothetical protein
MVLRDLSLFFFSYEPAPKRKKIIGGSGFFTNYRLWKWAHTGIVR